MTTRAAYPEFMAAFFHERGYSLIPVRDDKTPAIEWKPNQTTRAGLSLVRNWISEGYQLAIVTGRVSGVVVIDFDDLPAWEQFRADLPDIARQLLTIRTRRGIHAYLSVNRVGAPIPSLKAAGIDFQADGRYVVAPGATIDGHQYTRATGPTQYTAPMIEGALKRIVAWVKARAGASVTETVTEAPGTDERLSLDIIAAYFEAWQARGRNNALFAAARLAHDHFYTESDTNGVLLPAFVFAGFATESPNHREREGRATIHSAFKRPRRPVRRPTFKQLPNIIRETLNARKLTAVGRTLDSLRQSGFGPGALVSYTVTRKLLAGVVGDYSIRRFFEFLRAHCSPKTLHLAHEGLSPKDTNCICIGQKNQQLGHRTQRLYPVPSDSDLAKWLGISSGVASDPLKTGEFKTVRTYRGALHREFIKRKPGQHSMRMLAAKYGVTRQTIRNYNRIEGIKAVQQYGDMALKWHNINLIGDPEQFHNQAGKLRTRAMFIETNGERYPALPAIAVKHLQKGLKPVLKWQQQNYYYHKSQWEKGIEAHIYTSTAKPKPDTEQLDLWGKMYPPQDETPAPRGNIDAPGNAPRNEQARKRAAKRRQRPAPLPAHQRHIYARPMADYAAESLAQDIVKGVPGMTINTARRIVHLCPPRQIYRALRHVASAKHIRQPAAIFAIESGFTAVVRLQKEQKKQRQIKVAKQRIARRERN